MKRLILLLLLLGLLPAPAFAADKPNIISILPTVPKVDPDKPFHRNIRIVGNDLYGPWQGGRAMLTFKACKDVKVAGNTVDPDALGRDIAVEAMAPDEITVASDQGLEGP